MALTPNRNYPIVEVGESPKAGSVPKIVALAGAVDTDVKSLMDRATALENASGANANAAAANALAISALQPRVGAFPIKIATFTLVANAQTVAIDTRLGGFTGLLPASPSGGDQASCCDIGKALSTYPMITGRNGQLIEGQAADFPLTINGVTATFVFVGGAIGWRVVLQAEAREPISAADVVARHAFCGGL